MASQDLHAKAQDALVALNAAIKNIKLYPPASAMVQKSIERVLTFLEAIFESEDELAVAESEKNLLILGTPLTEKEQQKPQVVAFIATLLDFGVKSLAIKKGVTTEELGVLFQTLSRKAEDVNAEGGLQAALADSNLPHIILDEKVYMAVDGDQPLVADMGIAGDEIGKFITSGQAASEQDMGQLKEMAKDPTWVANVFSTGIKELHGKGGDAGGATMAGTLQHLVETFESLTDKKGQATITREVAGTVVAQDDETLIPILAKDYAGQLGKTLFSQILDRMPDDQFERIVLKLKDLASTGDRTAPLAYQNLLISEKGQQLSARLQKRPPEVPPPSKKQKIAQLKAGLDKLIQGQLTPLEDPDFVKSLPNVVAQFISRGKSGTVDKLVENITRGVTEATAETRPQISQVLEKIGQQLTAEKQAAIAKVLQPETAPETLAPESAPEPEAAQPESAVEDLVDTREAQINELVAAGDTDTAVKLLFDLIVDQAKRKNFKKAEELRDRLYDVDAMALTEILKAGEIIEQEKTESIDQDHLEIWPELYNTLSEEETNALFHALKEVTYDIDQTVFEQGTPNRNLYFITAGSLKLVYQDDEREILLKTLEPGDVAGHATFFSISMCTTSLHTLSNVTLNVLSQTALEEWEESFPALKSKLEDYCLTLDKSRDLIKAQGIDRRKYERFRVKGKILVQLLSKKHQPMGKPFKGDIADISEGGLSFFIITSKRETARTLLGRRLGMKFLIPTRAAPLKTFQQGTVICVNYHLKNDYSIHVSFDGELPAGIAGAIKRLKNIKTE